MNEVKPWGDPRKAEILVIGHDPRLRKSDAEAEYAFFFNYLEHEEPKSGPEKSKYGLAKALVDYISQLTSSRYGMRNRDKLFVTNLCNRFLERPDRGTVLIPEDEATIGINEINKVLVKGSFKLILSMSLQVFYHLARSCFVSSSSSNLQNFIGKAQPPERDKEKKVYVATEPRAFVDVCGEKYWHDSIAVVPVLHVKAWQTWKNREPYLSRTVKAIENIKKILS